MQITYDDESFRSVVIDESALATFLKEHGAKKRGLSTLEIRLCMAYLAPLEKLGTSQSGTVGGTYCREENLIELYLYPLRSKKFLNEALIHESRHFIQFQQGEKRYDWDAELYLPYDKRPSEIDAHAFTKKHKKLQFLTIGNNQLLQKQVKTHFSQYWRLS